MGFQDCISANGFCLFCLPRRPFACMQPKPAQTGLVSTTQTTKGLQTETRTFSIPKSCPLPSDPAFICRYLFIEINKNSD